MIKRRKRCIKCHKKYSLESFIIRGKGEAISKMCRKCREENMRNEKNRRYFPSNTTSDLQ